MDCRHLPGDPAALREFDWDDIIPPKPRNRWLRVWVVLASLGLVPMIWRVWHMLPDRRATTIASGWTDAELWRERHEVLRRAVDAGAAARLAPLLRRIDRMARALPSEEADAVLFWKTFAVLRAGGVPAEVPAECKNTRRLLQR